MLTEIIVDNAVLMSHPLLYNNGKIQTKFSSQNITATLSGPIIIVVFISKDRAHSVWYKVRHGCICLKFQNNSLFVPTENLEIRVLIKLS